MMAAFGWWGVMTGGGRNDVWRSADGARWAVATLRAGFAGRFGHQVVAYDGSLWVVGGYCQCLWE